MTRTRSSRARPLRTAVAAVGLALLGLAVGGCASSTHSSGAGSASTSASPPPSAAAGYWRSPANTRPSKLVNIRLIDGRYYLWFPPSIARAPLAVQGDRLVRHHYQHGNEIEREVYWARPDGTLALVAYLPAEGGRLTALPVLAFTKATGRAAQLAAELHGRLAEPTIEKQVGILLKAVGDWASQHGRLLPRAALRPGGAFWAWKGAPHLTNAISGGPMALGSQPGNFDYSTTGNYLSGDWSSSISGHLGYGLPDTTQAESAGQ